MGEENYAVKAEGIYDFIKSTSGLFKFCVGDNSFFLEDKNYKELVCEYIATCLEAEHLQGFNEGRNVELESNTKILERMIEESR